MQTYTSLLLLILKIVSILECSNPTKDNTQQMSKMRNFLACSNKGLPSNLFGLFPDSKK